MAARLTVPVIFSIAWMNQPGGRRGAQYDTDTVQPSIEEQRKWWLAKPWSGMGWDGMGEQAKPGGQGTTCAGRQGKASGLVALFASPAIMVGSYVHSTYVQVSE